MVKNNINEHRDNIETVQKNNNNNSLFVFFLLSEIIQQIYRLNRSRRRNIYQMNVVLLTIEMDKCIDTIIFERI